MKCFLFLPVLALAALGAPGPQPAPPDCPGLNPVGPLPRFPGDAWLDSLYGPPDTVYGDTFVSFGAALHASQPYNASVRIDLWANGTYRWGETRAFYVPAGDSVVVDWGFSTAGESGYYMVRDMFIDFQPVPADTWTVTWQFWILPGGGVEEHPGPQVAGRRLQPTFIGRLPAGAAAFDAMGRRVLNPRPGIYFLRPEPTDLPRKVLLVE